MSTKPPHDDMTVGESVFRGEALVPLLMGERMCPSRDAKVRMWIGFACSFSGAMRKSIGLEDASMVLRAALAAIGDMDEPG